MAYSVGEIPDFQQIKSNKLHLPELAQTVNIIFSTLDWLYPGL